MNMDRMASPSCPNFEDSLYVNFIQPYYFFSSIFHQRHNNRYMANIFISCNRNYIINKIYDWTWWWGKNKNSQWPWNLLKTLIFNYSHSPDPKFCILYFQANLLCLKLQHQLQTAILAKSYPLALQNYLFRGD